MGRGYSGLPFLPLHPITGTSLPNKGTGMGIGTIAGEQPASVRNYIHGMNPGSKQAVHHALGNHHQHLISPDKRPHTFTGGQKP